MQAVVSLHDIPIATTLVIFFQQLGGTLFISVGQSVLENNLLPQMQAIDSSLTSSEIIHAGVTGLKGLVPGDRLPQVLIAYARSVNATFQVATAMAAIGVVIACFVEWKSVKTKKSELFEP